MSRHPVEDDVRRALAIIELGKTVHFKAAPFVRSESNLFGLCQVPAGFTTAAMREVLAHLTHGPTAGQFAREIVRSWLRGLRDRWRMRFPPRRTVLDHAHPVVRWLVPDGQPTERGRAGVVFMERLSCGHLLDLQRPPIRRRRPCWKCARSLPRDARARAGSVFSDQHVEFPGVRYG